MYAPPPSHATPTVTICCDRPNRFLTLRNGPVTDEHAHPGDGDSVDGACRRTYVVFSCRAIAFFRSLETKAYCERIAMPYTMGKTGIT